LLVIGLTGGTGSGKGCVGRIFSSYGIDAIDTDDVSRNVCRKGSRCLAELSEYFGSIILNSDGTLNRKLLASIAFSDKEKHSMLNMITHKYILGEVREWLSIQKAAGKAAAIVDAPLLFESGFDKECDIIISVTAPAEIRIERIMNRDGIDIEAAKLRLSKQGNDTFYTSRSDYVIINAGDLDQLRSRTEEIVKVLLKGDIK